MNRPFVTRLTGRLERARQDLREHEARRDLRLLESSGVVSFGRRTYGVPRVKSWVDVNGQHQGGRLRVGSFCSIAENVTILLGGNHNAAWVTTYPLRIMFGQPGASFDGQPWSKGDVVIGDDVWLAHGCTILSGVTIGTGAVVAAGAMVTRDVAPYSVVAGNPAACVKMRFDEDIIERLLDLRWWEWPDEDIIRSIDLLSAPPSARALQELGLRRSELL